MKDISGFSKQELLDDLEKYLKEQIALVERQELSSEAFSKAAWPFYQANNLGKKKAFLKILEQYYD